METNKKKSEYNFRGYTRQDDGEETQSQVESIETESVS